MNFMLRAAALSLLILVSVAVMLPLVDSSAHNSGRAVAERRSSHLRHRHSRTWWRRYRSRLRRQRAAAKRRETLQTAGRGRSMNAAAGSMNAADDSHNSNQAVLVGAPAAGSEYKSLGSGAMSLPSGWVRR